jgi:2,5-diamino-6-(ribosylamino)-4(3H)-pyrimidinone 5'-phosphate reductase
MTPTSRRPRVVCHMMASVDGRIVTEDWPLSAAELRQYEAVHETYGADAWIVGRVTMEQHFAAGARSPSDIAQQYSGSPREDFIAPGEHESFAIAVDPSGRLVWDAGEMDGDHIVAMLTERVSDDYLASLRQRGVSYLLAGRDELDLVLGLEKIGSRLGVRTLMLEGGGGINGSILRAGLVDELSLLVAPVADGRAGMATLFDVDDEGFVPRRLALESVERRADDMLWLRYRIEDDA